MSFLTLPRELRFYIYELCMDANLLAQLGMELSKAVPFPQFSIWIQHSNDPRTLDIPRRADFRLLCVCRQTHQEMLSLLPCIVPLDIRFGMAQNVPRQNDVVFMEHVIQKLIPTWFASQLLKVACWSDDTEVQAGFNLFPSLQTVVLRGRGHKPLRPILRKSEWGWADVETSEVRDALRVKSMELLNTASTNYDTVYPGRAFRIMLRLCFGGFQVRVLSQDRPQRQGHTFVNHHGHTLDVSVSEHSSPSSNFHLSLHDSFSRLQAYDRAKQIWRYSDGDVVISPSR